MPLYKLGATTAAATGASSFLAPTQGGNYTPGSKIIYFNTPASNIGNCFDYTTGIFTAPAVGVYQFTTNMTMQNIQNSGGYFYIQVNGVTVTNSETKIGSTCDYSWTINLSLAANDQVTLYFYNNEASNWGSLQHTSDKTWGCLRIS